jgi:peptidoglycan L-alanyl-D-glutamate endopeptidase CwlK
MTKLNATSLVRMRGVDPTLVQLVKRAREISPIAFEITEGLRTKERQAYLVKTGKSRTMNSYHLRGKAIDFVAKPGGEVSWKLADYQTIVNKAFKAAAKELGLTKAITYGVEWKSIVDGPHVQIET